MIRRDFFFFCKIGDGAGDFDDFKVGAGGLPWYPQGQGCTLFSVYRSMLEFYLTEKAIPIVWFPN